MIDWQALLRKYMAFVQDNEGVTFVEHLEAADGFTPEEIDVLTTMGDAVVEDEQRRHGVLDNG